MLLGVIYIYVVLGSTHCYVLLNNDFSVIESRLLWLAFFASFSVKVPMVPVHIWLPEAHVEAPTAGSVLLAGILLNGNLWFVKIFITYVSRSNCVFSTTSLCYKFN